MWEMHSSPRKVPGSKVHIQFYQSQSKVDNVIVGPRLDWWGFRYSDWICYFPKLLAHLWLGFVGQGWHSKCLVWENLLESLLRLFQPICHSYRPSSDILTEKLKHWKHGWGFIEVTRGPFVPWNWSSGSRHCDLGAFRFLFCPVVMISLLKTYCSQAGYFIVYQPFLSLRKRGSRFDHFLGPSSENVFQANI